MGQAKLAFVVTPEVFDDQDPEVIARENLFELLHQGVSIYIAVDGVHRWEHYPPDVRAIELARSHDPEFEGWIDVEMD